jgi:hypothetical protein
MAGSVFDSGVFDVVTKTRSNVTKQLIFMASLNRKCPFIISRPGAVQLSYAVPSVFRAQTV